MTAEANRRWRWHLAALASVWAALLLLFRADIADMAGQYWYSSTYTHCLIVPPMLVWLVHDRSAQLRRLRPAGWWPGLIWFGLSALLWLAGTVADIHLLRHIAVIGMTQGSVVAILGTQVARGLLFPLAYMAFLVPFGGELEPRMQQVTADISMLLLRGTGIPAVRDGIFITTPAGYFKVAEACSGVKFLTAMAAFSVFAAMLCFRRPARRMLFVLFALSAAVIGNGIRAYGTMALSGIVGIEFAESFDHIFYGWVFFALIMGLVMAVGWRFFDRPAGEPFIDPTALPPQVSRSTPLPVLLVALMAITAAMLFWADRATSPAPDLFVPKAAPPHVPGWSVAIAEPDEWAPRFAGADRRYLWRYRNATGATVDVAIALFAWQGEGRELAGYGQGAVDPASDWAWTRDLPPIAGGRVEQIAAPSGRGRLVASWYLVGDDILASRSQVKLATVRQRLFGGRPDAAAVLVSVGGNPDPENARQIVADFVRAAGGAHELAVRSGRGR